MKRTRHPLFWTGLLSISLSYIALPSYAANQYFMPGDAFFYSVLSESILDEMDQSENPVFKYHRPDFLPFMLCGYAGFGKLQYNNMPPPMKRNLRQAYKEMREFTPKQIEITQEYATQKSDGGEVDVPTGRELHTEINGFPIFFYNRSFDRKRFQLALKYNEQWADQFAAFGHKRDTAILETFVPIPEAIAKDWRDGALVPALQAKVPSSSTKNIYEPIQVESDVAAIVVSSNNFKKLYEGAQSGFGDLFTVYLITADEISTMEFKDGYWQKRKKDPSLGFPANQSTTE